MFRYLLLIALIVLGTDAALEREVLRSHCRLMTLYASGPGSLGDFLDRWAFYMNSKGKFGLPGEFDESVDTPDAWKQKIQATWGPYNTFNHVMHPEEPTIDDNTCTMDVYHAFLAWDGRCGPLIYKFKLQMKVDPEATSAEHAKIVEWENFFDVEALKAQIESCAPQGDDEAAKEEQ
eukprot:NODE_1666_length_777_cov_357.524615_g1617_i0.p1 GENE.NODE_1666_length_777_cov_357.524615_g1617_i0~~NODE_1666_length_777_cov_357.524615_g1617_i0.p1  ORF type:complete len:177 (+),score=43.82 NODE_1666_length_777_cov_357.524615_g1617_i0:89-619(+)